MAVLDAIKDADSRLTRRFGDKLVVNRDLSRTLVSFQANKRQSGYRWFKYKEGFSASLVTYLLDKTRVSHGRLIDPFAGSGAALFGAAGQGIDALGIELLPVGREIIEARKLSAQGAKLAPVLARWAEQKPWRATGRQVPFRHLRITEKAFPPETEASLGRYTALVEEEGEPSRSLLRFAAMCVLEDVSYTRKDGQYLRWDHRSGRRQGAKPFDKGSIPLFEDAVADKLRQIADDLGGGVKELFPTLSSGEVEVVRGSCLDVMPRMEAESFDCLITSPPYCNRYDYTPHLRPGTGLPGHVEGGTVGAATGDGFLHRRESGKGRPGKAL